MKRCVVFLMLALALTTGTTSVAQPQRAAYLEYIKEAADNGWDAYPQVIERWKAQVDPSALWGYNSPSQPVYLADVLGFLYQETGDPVYARRASRILAEYGDLREAYPEDYADTRAEYDDGLPALSNFFFLPAYSRAYMRIADSDALDEAERAKIEQALAGSLDFVFHFPEWGGHNRAIIRALGLTYGAQAMPDHPHAERWRKMANVLASDNLSGWEAEDAGHYNGIWLKTVLAYAQITGQDDLYASPRMHYYANYYKRLFTPAHTMPAYGDADWNPSAPYYLAAFERLASQYQDPELKWVATQLFDRMSGPDRPPGVGAAASVALAYRWADTSLTPRRPTSGSQEALDDVVGKKVVFRDGWSPESTYMLLNYRNEGPGGFATRRFLRNTLTVEEEKVNHGHADENSIIMLMDDGALLLHDGGYRSGLPSGPYGAFRADYFHNRLVARRGKRDARVQTVPEFIRNAGTYRPVETKKIDFLTLRDVDMSRTRLVNDERGYAWDRILTYVKPLNAFIVIDAVRALRDGYFTFTNLWHTRRIHTQGPHYYDTSIDSVGDVSFPQHRRLLINFMETYAKTDSVFSERRHFQDEKAIYQSQSSHYLEGDLEVFVTALVPHDAEAPVEPLIDRMELIRPEKFPEAVGVKITHGDAVSYLGAKLDLKSELVRENIRPRYTWETGRTAYGPFTTDGHFLFATVHEDSLRYAASQVMRVEYEDTTVMEAEPNTFALQPDGEPPRVAYPKWRYWEDTVAIE